MKLSVDKVPVEGLEIDYREPANSFSYLRDEDGEAGAGIVDDINVVIRADKKSDEIIIAGRLKGSAVMNCGRCLEKFTEDISHEFSYNCLPQTAMEAEKEELSIESADTCFYSGGDIDITALVHEQVALALPMRPLCKEDCKGLCPDCGANLNNGKCGCLKDSVDLRLAALKDFKIK